MIPNRSWCGCGIGARSAAWGFAVIAAIVVSRAEATPVVSVSGPSTAGWTLNPSSNTANNGTFTGSAGTLSGTWWGLYSRSGQLAEQKYSFASAMQTAVGSSVLPVGGTIQIDVSLGYLDNGAVCGISLQNASGVSRFETFYRGNHPTNAFKLIDAGGEENITGVDTSFAASSWKESTSQFQRILFTQLAGNAYTLSFDGSNVSNTGLTIDASDISVVRFFDYNSGVFSDNDQFANNLIVVPEPGGLVLASVAVMAAIPAVLRRWRRGVLGGW